MRTNGHNCDRHIRRNAMPVQQHDRARSSHHRRALVRALYAFVLLSGLALSWFVMSNLLDGGAANIFTSPIGWLDSLDTDSALNTISEAASIVAGILGIAITVVAIVVELAANRYSHRITWLFLTEPVNIVITSLFMLTTVECLWVAATLEPADPTAILPNAGFALTMVLVSLSLLVLLPYFFFLFQFLSPLSVVQRLADSSFKWMTTFRKDDIATAQQRAEEEIEELLNVARTAVEQSDRGVAMACVDALQRLLLDYRRARSSLDEAWFRISPTIARDPDFVSLAPQALQSIDDQGIWVEVKIFRQFLSLMAQCVPNSRDVANLIAIRSEEIGRRADSAALRNLCIRCFNSYLRTGINGRDPRTTYYILDQYRLLAEACVQQKDDAATREIAEHFRFYGQLAYRSGQPFILEVAAHDLLHLIERAVATESAGVDDLLGVLLELDLEIRTETQEESLIGVRRAQLQAAALFEQRGETARVQRICADLRGEIPARLQAICKRLLTDDRSEYWEFTDRGVNFGYLAPERRPFLKMVCDRLAR
jgi:hypothetical protein